MVRGLYTSAIGMAIQQKRMDTASNNLSNASTTGFRRDVVVTQAFSDVLARRVRDYELQGISVIGSGMLGPMSLGVTINTIHRDFSSGSLSQTGSAFDTAIIGQGFFRVAHVNSEGEVTEMFTRDGSFTMGADGTLVTLGGFEVLDATGAPITIPEGIMSIGAGGEVIVDGEHVATLGMVTFESLADLRPFGHNLYTAIEEAVQMPFAGRIQQGYIESSNVNTVQEMVTMIAISRAYEANSRMIQMQDDTLRQAVNEIARA
ncbi:MAG: flagellar hook-basal body protein [Defluviitaleaceae bacterium]|nr:flagellar hook-basal body protein [Defluviitaleaceae bacterium]